MSADVSLVMSCGAAVTSGAGPAFIRIAIIGRIAIGSGMAIRASSELIALQTQGLRRRVGAHVQRFHHRPVARLANSRRPSCPSPIVAGVASLFSGHYISISQYFGMATN
jgi:hypothetical protein